jgi:hypothetical protein
MATGRWNAPFYSYLHKKGPNKTIVYVTNIAPTFYKKELGLPLPLWGDQ